MPDYPQEDIEARAWAPRTGFEHIPFGNAAVGLAGIPVVANRSALKAVRETGEAIERLMTRGYTPGQEDAQAVADAFTAAGVAGTGAFAGAAPKGSIGTFIGRRGAQNLSDAGKPTALKAIEMAERLEARGVSEGNIHAATRALIETEDPRLGIVHKGDDGAWRVEISDDKSRLRPIGPSISKLGRELTHPGATSYEQSVATLGDGVAPKDKGSRIIAKGQDRESWSVGRDSDEWPSAFDQAQEKRWEDLAQKGEVGQQSIWNEMGAHLHKPGQRGGGPGPRASILWSREANLVLAQMHKRGAWPSDIAAKMSDRFGRRYTEDHIASQLEALGLVGSNRKLPSSTVGEWQPDAVAILQSDRVQGMSAAQIAKLIEEETGQITTKNSVIGKLNRLRQERQRAKLAEDLAKGGMKLKAAGVPAHNGEAERRRTSWSLWDRISFWGGY